MARTASRSESGTSTVEDAPPISIVTGTVTGPAAASRASATVIDNLRSSPRPSSTAAFTRTATLAAAAASKATSWKRTGCGSRANASRIPPHAGASIAQSFDR